MKGILVLRRRQLKIFTIAKCFLVSAENFCHNLRQHMKLKSCQVLGNSWGFTKLKSFVVWGHRCCEGNSTASTRQANHTEKRLHEELKRKDKRTSEFGDWEKQLGD